METENSLTIAIRKFEIVEANLVKLERIWDEIRQIIPDGVNFTNNEIYEDKVRFFIDILASLPKIDGWKPDTNPWRLSEVAQSRLDAIDVGEAGIAMTVEDEIYKPGKELRQYRFLFGKQRRQLIRRTLSDLVDEIDNDISNIPKYLELDREQSVLRLNEINELLQLKFSQVDALLGSTIKRPIRWGDLHRHMHFAQPQDFHDIVVLDWPEVKKGLKQNTYEDDEPIPIDVEDLSDLVSQKPTGIVSRELKWNNLTPEQFERLIFSLIGSEQNYENPQWLTKTNAPDRGRDLSVEQIINDPLIGTSRLRVIIQCKHWLTNSVTLANIQELKGQMTLWEPPRVDKHIIATSGRFTTDAVSFIEKHNISDSALKIIMWPESHLEMLLASRPALIAEFGLR